jgi:Heme/copper-type cytochrome/quinol oxidase, subunit 3
MPSTLTDKKLKKPREEDRGRGNFNELPPGYGGDGDGKYPPERTPPPEGYRMGIWLALASVSMMFLALTSAYVFNSAHLPPLEFPSIFIVSTFIVIASSACIEIARRSLRGRREHRFELWWKVTMGLGISFLVAQMCAWFQLVRNGFYVNTNRHSGFAYIFTVLHAVHLLGGIAALSFVYLKSRRGLWTAVRRRSSVDATAIYWHFLTGLWIYILLILFIWTL